MAATTLDDIDAAAGRGPLPPWPFLDGLPAALDAGEDRVASYRTSLSEGTEVFHNNLRERWLRGDLEVVGAMETWAGYAAEGRACLLQRNYTRLNQLVDANFDLRARIYQIDRGNLEMVHMARAAGATANFAGSGGAIVGTYDDEVMFGKLMSAGKSIGVAVIKPKIVS